MPSKRRPTSSRAARQVNAVRRTAAPQPEPGRGGLTTRAAVLGLVVCALVVSAALPLREYLSQRSQIDDARHALEAKKARVAALEKELRLLQDPDYVREEARTRLHFVKPGEVAYVVIAPTPTPAAPGSAAALRGAAATGPESPWYSQVWGSVRAADHPVPLPTPKP